MNFDDIATRGLVLLGCGKMGSAMLAGWLKRGLPAASVWVIDPKLKAISDEYETKQQEYLYELEEKVRWKHFNPHDE